MSWGIVAAAGASLVAGSMASSASKSAANTAAGATEAATEEQRRQFDLNRADQAPFIQTGTAANKRLAYLLGLTPETATPQTAESLRQELMPKYLVRGAAGVNPESQSQSGADYGGLIRGLNRQTSATPDFIDESGLQAAIDARLAQQTAPPPTDTSDASFGSLLKRFSQSDLEADPVYQNGLKFGLDQGTGAINARAIAGGGYDSGATLKALTRYANDYGNTKANESYNRFNNDQGTIYNRLAGVSGTGQQAVNQVGATGTQIANNISGLTQDAGSARAAGIVGGANAWGDALTGVGKAATNYSNQQWLSDLLKNKNGMLRGSDYGL